MAPAIKIKIKWPDLFCIGWGHLHPHDDGTHKSCPVVFLTSESTWESAIKAELLASGRSFPMVCPCDCKTCKHAWWEAGRPILKCGEIITTFT